MKVFITHSHKDRQALSYLKKDLAVCGINCFLAHDDIKPGEHDLETIKTSISDCDIFLIIGNKESKDSDFCNQEIGMAIAHKKPIISTIDTKCSPWGFIARQQAIGYRDIQKDLFDPICEEIILTGKYKQYWEKELDCLNILKIKGFCIDCESSDFLVLKRSDHNDYGYYTFFHVYKNHQNIANVRIGYQNQQIGMENHPENKLPKYFPFLKNKYFSNIFWSDTIPVSDKEQKALCFLLNSIRHSQSAQKYLDEEVVKQSLFRSNSTELEKLKRNRRRQDIYGFRA